MKPETNLQLTELLRLEISPAEAGPTAEVIKAELSERIREREAASAACDQRKAVCDTDEATLKLLHEKQQALTKQLADQRAKLRDELHALQGGFDFIGNASLLRQPQDALDYVTVEHDHIATVRMGSNHILYLDALTNLRAAEWAVLAQRALLSRVQTIAACAPLIEIEGAVGVVGEATERMRMAADEAWRLYQQAEQGAREYRQKYDRQLATLAARGMIGLNNIHGALAKY